MYQKAELWNPKGMGRKYSCSGQNPFIGPMLPLPFSRPHVQE
jgi:hypothetical protein